MKGIKWHLVNRWEGHGFRSHTFAAQLPSGALVKTTERYLAAAADGGEDLEHITTALTYVPGLEVQSVEDSGEYPALVELEQPAERMELDPRFYRPRIELDPELDGAHLEPQGSRRGILIRQLERLKLGFRNLGV